MKIALLVLSPLRHDSRVLRHAAFLARAGHEAIIIGQAPLPDHCANVIDALPGPGGDFRVRAGLLLRHAPARIWPGSSLPLYWASVTRQAALRKLLRFRPDVVIANDWRALPIADAAHRRQKTRVIYDSHEFGTEEFADSPRWRRYAQRHVKWIEKRFIRSVDAVMTVSEGLSEALAELYALAVPPTVIVNAPPLRRTAFRPTSDRIEVLYHGIVAPRRGLETLIASVPDWPDAFVLRIRGPSVGGFRAQLAALAGSHAARVAFDDPAPPEQVAEAARTSDIGVFLFADSTVHARFALPNKIFEYMSAGLMVISSDLPEVRRVVTTTGCGQLISGMSATAIAQALGGLDRAAIDQYKRRSLEAAKTFNFDAESHRLLALVESVAQN